MSSPDKKAEKLVFIFILGFILFHYPVLSLLNLKITIWGIPLLFLYLFLVWALLIISLAILMEFGWKKPSNDIS